MSQTIGVHGREDFQYVCGANAKAVYVGNHEVMARALGKHIFFLDSNDVTVMPRLAIDGFWESWITVAIGRIIKPGMNCIDLGANFGYYSVFMADLLDGSGNVWAIEPNLRCCELLEKTIAVNGMGETIVIIPKAVGEDEGVGSLCVSSMEIGNGFMDFCAARDVTDHESELVHCIPVTTVDQIVGEDTKVDFIKIDVEGAELEALEGADFTLHNNPEIQLIMEFYPPFLKNRGADLLTFLENHCFQLRVVRDDCDVHEVDRDMLLDGDEFHTLYLKR